MHEDNYIALLKEAMNKAYVPYSNYPVGALVVTDKETLIAVVTLRMQAIQKDTVQKQRPSRQW